MSFQINITSFLIHTTSFLIHITSFLTDITSFLNQITSFLIDITSFLIHNTSFLIHITSFLMHIIYAKLKIKRLVIWPLFVLSNILLRSVYGIALPLRLLPFYVMSVSPRHYCFISSFFAVVTQHFLSYYFWLDAVRNCEFGYESPR